MQWLFNPVWTGMTDKRPKRTNNKNVPNKYTTNIIRDTERQQSKYTHAFITENMIACQSITEWKEKILGSIYFNH